MKKFCQFCFTILICFVFVGCNRKTVGDVPSAEIFDEVFSDDYLEYATVDKADDYFKQCFEKVEGDWYSDDRTIGFFIEDDMYMMSGWTDRPRIIAFIDPVRKHENQFEIGLEAGELQEILLCEIVEENKEIIIKETVYVRGK